MLATALMLSACASGHCFPAHITAKRSGGVFVWTPYSVTEYSRDLELVVAREIQVPNDTSDAILGVDTDGLAYVAIWPRQTSKFYVRPYHPVGPRFKPLSQKLSYAGGPLSGWVAPLDDGVDLDDGVRTIDRYRKVRSGNLQLTGHIVVPEDHETSYVHESTSDSNYLFRSSVLNNTVAMYSWKSGVETLLLPSNVLGDNDHDPPALANDGDHLYIADYGGSRILIVPKKPLRVDQHLTELGGNRTGIQRPTGVALSRDGTIYVLGSGDTYWIHTPSRSTLSVFAPGSSGDVAPQRTVSVDQPCSRESI